jgi:hypothetical protein
MQSEHRPSVHLKKKPTLIASPFIDSAQKVYIFYWTNPNIRYRSDRRADFRNFVCRHKPSNDLAFVSERGVDLNKDVGSNQNGIGSQDQAD